jgi:hypothetical protein
MSNSDLDESSGTASMRQEREKRLDAAKTYYGQVINRLWGGNAAGALTALSAMGTSKDSIIGFELPLSLFCFLSGLLLLGVSSINSLWYQIRAIRDLERAEATGDPLTRNVTYIRRPSDEFFSKFEIGLASVAALLFCFGTTFGLLLIFRRYH